MNWVSHVLVAIMYGLGVWYGLPTHLIIVGLVGVRLRVGLIKVGYYLGYRGEIGMAKGSPYECGFDPISKA